MGTYRIGHLDALLWDKMSYLLTTFYNLSPVPSFNHKFTPLPSRDHTLDVACSLGAVPDLLRKVCNQIFGHREAEL